MQHEPEEQTFQLQALEIREPDGNFDPKKPPESGEEYLMHMLYERKRCPAVVTKRSPKIRDNAGNNTFEMLDNPALPPFKCLLTTPEWRAEQVKSFQAARSQVLVLRMELVNHNYDQSGEPPLTSDQEKWQEFCRSQQPLLSTLLHLSQSDLEQLLERLSKWLQDPESSVDLLQDVWLARWLYATLVCLHLPLEPHVFSNLRYIARSCIHLRNQLNAEEVQRAAPYNLLLTLIVQVFAQSDFKDYI
ncbi:protein Gemin2 [Drosophila subpulchrella]|uniref:protein Gemin2 n=1 Tax=Drosophila subpulchrella TaxID=1486046 RepID=UPI0018A197F2|nr:protein Gemin2 [Drosophila subpulchrella]